MAHVADPEGAPAPGLSLAQPWVSDVWGMNQWMGTVSVSLFLP